MRKGGDLPRTLAQDGEFNARLCGRTPANRWGAPSELVGAAVFPASKASSYVNGDAPYVEGGMLAWV